MPDEKWLAEVEKYRDKLASPCDLDEYFEKTVICGKKLVRYQRRDGDFINFTVPDTDCHIPICNSGLGDGTYPVYPGYDEVGNICRAVIQFIGSKEEE